MAAPNKAAADPTPKDARDHFHRRAGTPAQSDGFNAALERIKADAAKSAITQRNERSTNNG